jgi:uncharacterized membrane protein
MLNFARALTLVGLFASAATLWIYLAGMPTMKKCERTTPSVCQSVIVSTYGSILKTPLPVIGLFGFAIVMGLTLLPEGGWSLLRLVLGFAAVIPGGLLLAVQIGPLGRLCLFCVIADVAAAALGCVIAHSRLTGQRLDSNLSAAERWKWALLGVLAIFLSVPAWIIAGFFEAC